MTDKAHKLQLRYKLAKMLAKLAMRGNSLPTPQIKGLTDVTEDLRLKLHGQKVTCADDLWAHVGNDPDTGLTAFSKNADIALPDLIDLLVRQAEQEKRDTQGSRLSHLRRAISRHWLDLMLGLVLLLILTLSLRAAGLLAALPYPLGLHGTVLVAARELEAGRVLSDSDLAGARLVPGYNYFTELGEVRGLILTRALKLGEPIHYENVMRLQVIAARDLPTGTIMACQDFRYAWTPYSPDAAVDIDALINGRGNRAFASGEVIKPKYVEMMDEDPK